MIDKAKSLESFLEALERIEKLKETKETIVLVTKDGRKVKCELKIPEPEVEIALYLIKRGS
jgi:hypothetical protein